MAGGGTGDDEAVCAVSRALIHLNSPQSMHFVRAPDELPSDVVGMLIRRKF